MIKKYGQFMAFDLTYNLIKQYEFGPEKKTKKWGLGLFFGKNCNNKSIPFGVALMNNEKI